MTPETADKHLEEMGRLDPADVIGYLVAHPECVEAALAHTDWSDPEAADARRLMQSLHHAQQQALAHRVGLSVTIDADDGPHTYTA